MPQLWLTFEEIADLFDGIDVARWSMQRRP
jgi:hypothetical protein